MILKANKIKDKKQIINLDPGDWINYVKVGFDDSISLLNIKTFKGKSLTCQGSQDSLYKKE